MRAKDYHKKGFELRLKLYGYLPLTLAKLKLAMIILEEGEIPIDRILKVFNG